MPRAKPKAKAQPKAATKPARARSKPTHAKTTPRKAAGPGAKAEAALRAFALTLPEAHEEFPWGDRALKVGKKVFAFLGTLGTHDGGFAMSTKLARSAAMALTLPFASPTRYGLGKAGWVTAEFGPRETPPLAMMRAWIEESYRAIAPKTLVARLDAAPVPARSR
jgi:predicted DNA-binding protein (MmcQ/YjbR family)